MLKPKFGRAIAVALVVGVGCMSSSLSCDEAKPEAKAEVTEKKVLTKEELFLQDNLNRLAETYGHIIYGGLRTPYVSFNPDEIIKGIQNAKAGKEAPMSEQQYQQALRLIQQYVHEQTVKKQREEAEQFLKDNRTKEGVVEVVPGKVQYKVLQAGSGDEQVTEKTMPTVNYSATFLNATEEGASDQQGAGLEVDLSDCIPGFTKGVLGMKKGEKRRLFIHPEFAYGSSGKMNGLAMFDIEVVSIAPKLESDSSSSEESEFTEDDLAFNDTEELLARLQKDMKVDEEYNFTDDDDDDDFDEDLLDDEDEEEDEDEDGDDVEIAPVKS